MESEGLQPRLDPKRLHLHQKLVHLLVAQEPGSPKQQADRRLTQPALPLAHFFQTDRTHLLSQEGT
jgi:hypothetical protein